MNTYLEHGNGTHTDQDHNPHVHFWGEAPAVVVVVMAIVLFWVIQHVVVVLPCFFILQSEGDSISYGISLRDRSVI